jgi:hypothetical protein
LLIQGFILNAEVTVDDSWLVWEELILSMSPEVGLQMLQTQRKLVDQNEGLGHPSPEERAEELAELDRIEALLLKTHRSSGMMTSPEPGTAADGTGD